MTFSDKRRRSALTPCFRVAMTTVNSVSLLSTTKIGTTAAAVPPDPVQLDASVTSIAAGYDHVCALTVSGALLCWGTLDLSN